MTYWSPTAHLNRKTEVSHTHLIVLMSNMPLINDLFQKSIISEFIFLFFIFFIPLFRNALSSSTLENSSS